MSESTPADPVAARPAGDESPEDEFARLLARVENDTKPIEIYQLEYPFRGLIAELEKRGAAVPAGLQHEDLAFFIWPAGEGGSAWGVHFGQSWQAGALERVTAEALAYWRQRAAETPHPIMRARYADLVWELPKARRIAGLRPDAEMARIAARAYVEAVENRRYDQPWSGAEAGQRALEIALQLGDDPLVARARDVLLALDQEIASPEYPGLWVGFETFIAASNPKVPLTNEQRDSLVRAMEERLARFVDGTPPSTHPVPAEAAALHLARYYRQTGATAEVARVLRAYAGLIRRMRGTAAPMLEAHSLTLLYEHFKSFDLHADADALSEPLRAAGEESLRDMQEITVSQEIPREKVEAHYEALLAGDASEVLRRLALHYIPRRDEVEKQLKELAKEAPLSFLISHAIVDDRGRTVAHVGPLESDLEGNVVKQLSQNLFIGRPWLREAMRRGFERGLFSATTLLDFLFESPLFTDRRRRVLENGLEAYARGDSIAAVHVLVPQVEETLRELAILIGAPLYTQRRGGGFHARLFDEFLRDSKVGEVLGDSVTTYFRAFLSDPRGWNIRNDIAHGLASEGQMQLPVADRLVHVLLVLALLRASPPSPDTGPGDSQGKEDPPAPSEAA